VSVDDSYEIFLFLAFALFVAFLWNGVIRPFALSVVKASLYRLRDDLRHWYADLPRKQRDNQKFSFLFMERAINSVADGAGDITVWRIKYIRELQISGQAFSNEFEAEINMFLKCRDSKIKYIDDQHTIIFLCLLFINSPLIFLIEMVLKICYSLVSLIRGTSPLARVIADAALVRSVSHQQAPL
jgi:hypothetical protein